MHNVVIIIRSIFYDNKYYPQVYLDKCLYKLAELVLSRKKSY